MTDHTHCRIYSLGQFRVEQDKVEPISLRPRLAELLLLLILNEGKVVARSELARHLWPRSAPTDARTNLKTHLKLLKDAMPQHESRIEADREHVAFNMNGVRVDVFQFKKDLVEATRKENLAEIEYALKHYKGPLLPGSENSYIQIQRSSLKSLFLRGSMELSARLVSEGHTRRAIRVLSRAFELHPEAEQVVIVLLDLLADSPNDAGHVFESYCNTQRRMGLAPNEQVAARFRAINLAASGRPTAGGPPGFKYEPGVLEPGSIIGRELDIERISYRLASSSVIAITGSAGVGKSRVAAEICKLKCQVYGNGATIVDLTDVSSAAAADDLLIAVAAHLGVEIHSSAASPRDAVFGHLDQLHLLMVLDNVNQCSTTAFTVAVELHSRCPLLSIIITSAVEPENACIETVRLGPLSIGESDVPARILESDSGKLLVSCMTNMNDMLVLGQNARTNLRRLIEATGGLPLAIKLIAGACGGSLDNLVAMLSNPIQADTHGPAKEQYLTPLTGHIEWAVSQLSAAERTALYRLSIFRGGFSVDAASVILASIGIPNVNIKELLTNLRARAVLERTETDIGWWWHMLEPIRRLCLQRLKSTEDYSIAAQRHLKFFSQLAEKAKSHSAQERRQILQRLLADMGNFDDAFSFGIECGLVEQSITLALSLHHCLRASGDIRLSQHWMEQILMVADSVPAHLMRKVKHAAAHTAYGARDYRLAAQNWTSCLEISRQENRDDWAIADSANLAMAFMFMNEFVRAREFLDSSIAGFRERNNLRALARALGNLALLCEREGDLRQAEAYYLEAIELFRQLKDVQSTALALNNLASFFIQGNKYNAAHTAVAEAIRLNRNPENPELLVQSVLSLALLTSAYGDPERAMYFYGSADGLMDAFGLPRHPESTPMFEQEQVKLLECLGQEQYDAHYRAGITATREELHSVLHAYDVP